MNQLEDIALFGEVIRQGGFSHAAKFLGLSNGLVSRRIAKLEAALGVTLIIRTTRQLQLTAEGELLWQHAQRIQQELDTALTVIQNQTEKPKGEIRISAPIYFGRRYLMPVIIKFLATFPDITIDLVLTNQRMDPIKENLDLIIRGSGFARDMMVDSSLKTRLLFKDKIGLYASPEYLAKYGEPRSVAELASHQFIGFVEKLPLPEEQTWNYTYKDKKSSVIVRPKFNCNETESSLMACVAGYGIGRFSERVSKSALQENKLRHLLPQYLWGHLSLYAIYAQQHALPKRTRLLLDFLTAHTQAEG